MAHELGLLGLQCELSEMFAAKEFEHRNRIRQALHQSVSRQSKENLDSILNLQMPPRLQSEAISISHCPSLGGFVHIAKKSDFLGIGFDIEIANRVSLPTARKILSNESEFFLHKIAENSDKSLPAFIWAAKESAIKCVGNVVLDRQIYYESLAITEFTSSTDESCFQFRAALTDKAIVDFGRDVSHDFNGRIEARGIVRKTDQWILALAISYSLPAQLE